MSRPILVIGGTGQVGGELARQATHVFAPDRAELNLDDEAAVRAMVASRPWGAVINCAAYTAVDKAESEVVSAWRLNALAPAILAEATAAAGVPLVHVSTDYVFDGSKSEPYLPEDGFAPLGVYGASKLGGELAVASGNARHVIVRTAWVVSARRSNFVKTMLRIGAEREHIRVVDDQRGCPTSATDLAQALLTIVWRIDRAGEAAPWGTYHFANAGEATWCELARRTFDEAAKHGFRAPRVVPVSTADYLTPARRPSNSRLDTRSTTTMFGIVPRRWELALADIIDELAGAPAARHVTTGDAS